jgi:hypothetical protein
MTCRHAHNDPQCGGYEGRVTEARKLVEEYDKRRGIITPDANAYEIVEVEEIGPHLCLRVKYPNCAGCAFEGVKCLVFLNTRSSTALLWNEVDPHFTDPSKRVTSAQAPSPAARFPASMEGWADAIAYAKGKIVQHVMES